MNTLQERIDKFSCYTGDCIVWVGNLTTKNYPRITINGKSMFVHRINYKLHYGHLDNTLQLDHLCRNPCCINPGHLEPVTQSINMKRAYKASPRPKPFTCRKGHKYTEVTTLWHNGARECKICINERQREYRRRIKHDSR